MRLCLYDDQAAPVGALLVDRAGELCGKKGCWKSLGKAPPLGKGYLYKDKDAARAGVKNLKLQAAKAGKTQLQVSAANKAAKGQTALPTGITAALVASTGGVTVQVDTSNAGCFARTFPMVKRHDVDLFQAK